MDESARGIVVSYLVAKETSARAYLRVVNTPWLPFILAELLLSLKARIPAQNIGEIIEAVKEKGTLDDMTVEKDTESREESATAIPMTGGVKEVVVGIDMGAGAEKRTSAREGRALITVRIAAKNHRMVLRLSEEVEKWDLRKICIHLVKGEV